MVQCRMYYNGSTIQSNAVCLKGKTRKENTIWSAKNIIKPRAVSVTVSALAPNVRAVIN